MALPFFYETAIPATTTHFTLGEETSKHCIQVLRMKTGGRIQLTDGQGRLATALIEGEDKKKAVVLIESILQSPLPTRKISIGLSLLKNPTRFEWFLEKATEMGISEIQPMLCKHTERTSMRLERMKGILIAAMLQSQQTWLPILQEPVSFDKLVANQAFPQKLIAHCEEESKQKISDFSREPNTQILIGPEGDFSKLEIEMALDKQYKPVTLGDTRLRAETAALVAAVLLMNP